MREFVEGTEGTRILDVCRWGKQLFMPLDSGAHLLIHLGMSGRLHLEETPHESSTEPPERKHVHAVLSLESGHRLVFTDQRTFGELGIAPNRSFLAGKGPDPTDAAFDPEPLVAELGRHRVKIKAALLDQRLVAGLGNIYADEVCFLAQVHPATLACDVPEDGRRAIVAQLRPVLEQAIAAGRSILLEIDVQGGIQVAEKMPESVRIFVLPPNMESLRARLEGRKSEAQEQLRDRLAHADGEIAAARDSGCYDYFVVNDVLEQTVRQIKQIVTGRVE